MAAKHITAYAIVALSAVVAANARAQTSPAAAPPIAQQSAQTLLPMVRFPSGVNATAESLAEQKLLIDQQASLAASIEALCKTGYGPPQTCGGKDRPTIAGPNGTTQPAPGGDTVAAPERTAVARNGMPVFIEQTLWDGVRIGVVRFPDGHTEKALNGAEIGDRYKVIKVERDSLTLDRDGRRAILPLQTGSEPAPAATVPALSPLPPNTLPPTALLPAVVAAQPQQPTTKATPAKADAPASSLFSPESPIPAAPPKQTAPGTINMPDLPK